MEFRPCEDIGRQAARRNANAAARKASPGIAALACVRVLFRQTGMCILRAMLVAGRHQHFTLGEHGSSPGTHLAAKPRLHCRLVIPAANPSPRKRYVLVRAYRTARAGLLAGAGLGRLATTGYLPFPPPRARTAVDIATRAQQHR